MAQTKYSVWKATVVFSKTITEGLSGNHFLPNPVVLSSGIKYTNSPKQ